MISIKDFCENHRIELPNGLDLSDIYVSIYDKYNKELRTWKDKGTDGVTQTHYQWLYNVNDLEEYFNNEKDVL